MLVGCLATLQHLSHNKYSTTTPTVRGPPSHLAAFDHLILALRRRDLLLLELAALPLGQPALWVGGGQAPARQRGVEALGQQNLVLALLLLLHTGGRGGMLRGGKGGVKGRGEGVGSALKFTQAI